LALGDERDGILDQLADHAFHVTAVVTNFGVLGRFDFDEWSTGQFRQAPRDLGLTDAGRPNHQDILRSDLSFHVVWQLLATPAIADRDRDGPLGGILSDDVPV